MDFGKLAKIMTLMKKRRILDILETKNHFKIIRMKLVNTNSKRKIIIKEKATIMEERKKYMKRKLFQGHSKTDTLRKKRFKKAISNIPIQMVRISI